MCSRQNYNIQKVSQVCANMVGTVEKLWICTTITIYFASIFAHGAMLTFPDYRNHACTRQCTGSAMTCSYELTMEWLYSMEPVCGRCMNGTNTDCNNRNCVVADGLPRALITYNRMLPGPTISVCEGDTVIIDLHNDLGDVCTTMHTHGIHHRGTNHMDGVPMVTQCPIHPGNTFRYRFVANPAGTHWIHSHMGYQRVTGAFAPLIVRKVPAAEYHKNLYDVDNVLNHTISVVEWHCRLPHDFNLRINRMRIFEQFMTSILVNGFGANNTNTVPPKQFAVTRGTRYRFRIIGAQNTVCPIEMRIDGHRFTVIASDGFDIVPINADRLIINPGERYDIVINANQTALNYYINFRGLIDCDGITGRGLLAYSGATSTFTPPASTTTGVIFNCINRPRNTANCINIAEARAVYAPPTTLTRTPDFKYYMVLDTIDFALPKFQGVRDNEITTPSINNISWVFPRTPLIQDDSYSTSICNWENTASCRQADTICSCTHGVGINENVLVEIIIVDEGSTYDLSHPMHFHGYSPYVIGQDQLGSRTNVATVRNLDGGNQLMRNFNNPIRKDTISVPDGGYTVVRFIADNPGYWFFHCHVEHHAEEGMNLVFRVGQPSAPPSNFPRCGDYYG